MSIAVLRAEVGRFLSNSTPEVLCIKGKWGVGKTYGFRKFLMEAKNNGRIAADKYSYVSLFGLSSLDDLRYAIFENTVSRKNIGRDADTETFSELLKNQDNARKMKPLVDILASIVKLKGLSDVIAKSAFLAVRNQIVCLDDLERAGSGLAVREVLGLASLLKEQRACKIVLLLNDEQHTEKEEFERQLEKVADVTLRFEPTSFEAAEIAFGAGQEVAVHIQPLIVKLGITNIRIIKKIERSAARILEILRDQDNEIVAESMATMVLAMWSIQEPGAAPSLRILKNYNSLAFSLNAARGSTDPEVGRFRALIEEYPFRSVNELDRIIINGAEVGYFAEEDILRAAAQLASERAIKSAQDFDRAWEELYHGSLAADDDIFLDALYESAKKDARSITPININSAIRILRESGRGRQADDVVNAYLAAHHHEKLEFFNIGSHHFDGENPVDDGLRLAFEARRAANVDTRDPLDVLKLIGSRRSWDEGDVALMGRQSADDFERMFEN